MTDPIGGPAIPGSISTDPPQAGPALRVYRDDSAQATGGPALPVYLASDAEVADRGDQGNVPVPLAIVNDDRPVRGDVAPIPVYVVNDVAPEPTPEPDPPAGLLFQVTARDSTVIRDGSNLVTAVLDDYGQVTGFTAAGVSRPTYNATAGPGGIPALVFAGAQRLTMNEASAGQANFALECWGYVTNAASGAQMWIGSDQDSANYYVNLYPAPNALASYLESGLSNATLIDPTNITSGVWHHAVIVKSGTVFRLYLDGAEVDSNLATAGTDPTPGYGWQIGNSTLDEPLTGRVHQVAWWNIAPSAGQIAARYAAGPRAADGSGF